MATTFATDGGNTGREATRQDPVYYGTSRRLPAPPGRTRRYLRDLCGDPATRPAGAVHLGGRGGWMLSDEDWLAYLRSRSRSVEVPSVDEARAHLARLGVLA